MILLARACFAAALLPLAFIDAAYHPLARATCVLLAAAGSALAWSAGRRPAGNFLSAAAASMAAAALLSAILSPFSHSAAPGFLSDAAGVLVFLFFSVDGDAPFWTRGALLLLAAPLFFFSRADQTRVWVNPNVWAGVLLLLWPFAAEAFPAAGRKVLPVLVPSFLFLFDSWPAVAVFAVQAALMGAVYFRGSLRLKGKWIFAAALAAVGVSAAVPLWDADRAAWWRAAVEMFRSSPLWGLGPGSFGEAFPGFRGEAARLNTLFAHGFLFETLAERGALGLAAAGATFLALARRGASRPLEARTAGAGMGVAGFAAYNLLNVGFSLPGSYWLFWAQAGIWAAMTHPREDATGACKRAPLVFSCVFLALSAFLLARGTAWLEEARDEAVPAAREASATAGLNWTPWEPELFALRARARADQGRFPEAEKDMDEALRRSPYAPSFRAEAGDILLLEGRRSEAAGRYEEAVRLLPMSREYRARLEDIRHGQN